MFKDILGEIWSIIRSRIFIIAAIFTVLFVVLIVKLYSLQIIHGEEYQDTFTYRIEKQREINSARGNIYDRNGNVLASNRLSYNVIFEESSLLTNNSEYNTMINNLIELLHKYNCDFIYNIPIDIDENGEFYFTKSDAAVVNFKKDIFSILYSESLNEKQKAMTAKDMYDYIRSDSLFSISDEYDERRTLDIAALRFEIYMKRYMKYQSVVVAQDISMQLVAAVKENAEILPGVAIEQDYVREYTDSPYFAHLTGYIAEISQEELDEFSEQGYTDYSMGDKVGKAGLELVYEHTLAGRKGMETMYVNNQGSVIETVSRTDAIGGNDVYLTIDKDLTERIYDMLEAKIAGIILSKLYYNVDEEYDTQNLISINKVYYALIDNGIIRTSHFSADDATPLEEQFYKLERDKTASVITEIRKNFTDRPRTPDGELTEEYQKYDQYIYNYLKANDILYGNMYGADDEYYAAWESGKSSLGDFLMYAIASGFINTDVLSMESEYPDTSEAYVSLIDYICKKLPDDPGFIKLIYYYLLNNGDISGAQICTLLYDQGVLEKDAEYNSLMAGKIDGYTFMYSKIEKLEITPDMLALDTCSAACVVTDVKTGEVRALVSYPSFDANRLSDSNYYMSLISNGASPLYNRATRQRVAPGSTFKMISAIAGLEEYYITPDTLVYDEVEFDKIDPPASCWSKITHGLVNVTYAIEVSCNYFFYNLAYNMSINDDGSYSNEKGLNILAKYAALFGLDEKSGVEIYEEEPHISTFDSVRSAIGQAEHNYTATQINRYTTAVANKGTLFKLSIVDKITNAAGTTVEEITPQVERKIDVAETTWSCVTEGMRRVCANTAGYKDVFTSLNVSVAGKTGTAQESEDKPDHALMTGFAPVEDPQYCVTVLFPCGYGSSNVVDAFRDVIAMTLNQPLYHTYESENHLAMMPFNYNDSTGHVDDDHSFE
ncbi:MAG: hypothetical protein IJL97_01955 [Lachnospiraceae bacterium]|nr:hypothetical protein [Lachnospiraceae bacterium]